ncbi:MAG: choice-of-anchor tandem repeat NxxGxxAF-containing protein, partial [Pirellulaceae bacterium]
MLVLLAMVAIFGVQSKQADAQGRIDVAAQAGQAAAGGNGTYSTFQLQGLNQQGQIAFSATLSDTSNGANDNSGLFAGVPGSVLSILREGTAVPGGNGVFDDIGSFASFDNNGQIAAGLNLRGTSGGSNDNSGIFRLGGTPVLIAREGGSAAGNGTFGNLGGITIGSNDLGQVVFISDLIGTSGGVLDDQGIFTGSGGALTQIVRQGQAAPDSNGTINSLFGAQINNLGQVAFSATISGGTSNQGIFRSSGGVLGQVARVNQASPDNNGQFANFGLIPALNNSGQVAFTANLNGTIGGSLDDSGIFKGVPGSLTTVVREGAASTDGNGTLSSFSNTFLSDSGFVAFHSLRNGTVQGQNDNAAVVRERNGSLNIIATEGSTAPGGNGIFRDPIGGNFSPFNILGVNNSGVVAFSALLSNTTGGSTDDRAFYLGDGIDTLQVVREGDSSSIGTITSFNTQFGKSFNDFGQFAYTRSSASGTQVVTFTPDLHWRGGNDTWENNAKWTLSLNPGRVHDVFLNSAASSTVQGPSANTEVRSLSIGGGTGLVTLNLQNGSTLTASSGTTIGSSGTLTGDGTIQGNITNNGTILANNVGTTNTIFNNGTIRGNGRIRGDIQNNAAGRIRSLSGSELWLANGTLTNGGLIEVQKAELRVDGSVVNQASTGLISVRSGSLIVNSLANSGSMAMTFGASTIQGDINNTGTIQVSGGAHATFFDDITQNGVMQISSVGNSKSTAVILGAFSGSGGFVGGGDLFALGDLRPGNSPDSVLYGGNVFLGNSTDTFIELGGLSTGQFDQMLVLGDLNLNGDLLVSLIDGHSLAANQFYLIGDIGGSLSGQFNGLGEGSLVGNFGGVDLFISYAGGSGNDIMLFTAVPEPGCLLLLGGTLLGLVCQRRRKPLNLSQVVKSGSPHDDSGLRLTNLSRPGVHGGVIAICFCTIVLLESFANADLITINNAGFENPVLAEGATSGGSTPGWSGIGARTFLNPSTTHFSGGNAFEGLNVATLGAGGSGSTLFQNLPTTTLEYGTYKFEFEVGDRLDQTLHNIAFNFLINATTIVPLTSSSKPAVPDGEFRTWSFTYNVL